LIVDNIITYFTSRISNFKKGISLSIDMSKEIFYTVKTVKRETSDSISISFESSDPIQYKAGQYLTLIQVISGEEVRRCYSLSSSPLDKGLPTITLKKVQGGKMSTWLLENAKEGMRISGYAPMGNFVLPENLKKNNVYIGGGSGITPLYSMIRHCFKTAGLKQYLFYVNRNEESCIFRESLQEDANKITDFNISHHYTKLQQQPTSAVIVNWLNSLSIKPEETNFFLCGPEGLMKTTVEALTAWNVKQDAIFKELFFTTPNSQTTTSASTENKEYSVTIQFQKKTYSFIVPKDKTILESALDNKIRLPHSCQSGLCTACMGHCLQGQVTMVDPEGLSDNEIKKGCVLTCVGRPASEGVLIKID
jgi:ring-1,2-phenylacetyl-CoA epoxidase subunit PaaE